MKTVVLRELPTVKSIDLIKTVLERPGVTGLSVSDIRKRIRVLDVIEKLEPGAAKLDLEDGDHDTLRAAVLGFSYGGASKDLLTVIDDIVPA